MPNSTEAIEQNAQATTQADLDAMTKARESFNLRDHLRGLSYTSPADPEKTSEPRSADEPVHIDKATLIQLCHAAGLTLLDDQGTPTGYSLNQAERVKQLEAQVENLRGGGAAASANYETLLATAQKEVSDAKAAVEIATSTARNAIKEADEAKAAKAEVRIVLPIPISEIRGAVARGWTHPVNSNKEMDSALATAISIEVSQLLTSSGVMVEPDQEAK